MTASINVALGSAAPVIIPCPIPGSFTAEVRLGECEEAPVSVQISGRHAALCPARPVKVSCSIGGDGTWAGSKVTEVDWQTRNERGDWNPSPMSHVEREAALGACRARWEIVKALVLGTGELPSHRLHLPLFAQRDAVFAALADMARTEEAQKAASAAATAAIYGAPRVIRAFSEPEYQELLGRYVGRLVEQVGAL
jgi:hypothetical protein